MLKTTRIIIQHTNIRQEENIQDNRDFKALSERIITLTINKRKTDNKHIGKQRISSAIKYIIAFFYKGNSIVMKNFKNSETKSNLWKSEHEGTFIALNLF